MKNDSTSPEFHFCISIPVRFADCDALGHVNNAKYITYIEQVRVDYFEQVMGIYLTGPRANPKLSAILAEVSCTFKSPVHQGEIIVAKVRTSEMKRSSFIMEYEMADQKTNRLVAIGRTAVVIFNYEENKSVPIPDEIRKKIEEKEKRNF